MPKEEKYMTKEKLRIALFEPFYNGSHKQWADGLKKHSQHHIDLFTLPGKHWKWRMEGASVTFSNQLLASNTSYDLILATDMLNLGQFLAQTRAITQDTPVALYFHENQLLYPRKEDEEQGKETPPDFHYPFINFLSMMSADKVFFNSDYHRTELLKALPSFLKMFPDNRELSSIDDLAKKSETLYLGLDLSELDKHRVEKSRKKPLILWNHRWEYDKNPEDFFHTLSKLQQKCHDFELALLGQRFAQSPKIFDEFETKFKEEMVFNGYTASYGDYAKWLWEADILPVTSNQDFFGGSVVEAMYCNTLPILPNKLAYPEHIPQELHKRFLYNGDTQRLEKIEGVLNRNSVETNELIRKHVSRYDWKNCISTYDNALYEVYENKLRN